MMRINRLFLNFYPIIRNIFEKVNESISPNYSNKKNLLLKICKYDKHIIKNWYEKCNSMFINLIIKNPRNKCPNPFYFCIFFYFNINTF